MYDAATSKALWTLCRGYAALYNPGLEALRNEPALPLQNTAKEGIGLYGRLTEWRSTGRYGTDALPVAAARAALAQAHTARAVGAHPERTRADAARGVEQGDKAPPAGRARGALDGTTLSHEKEARPRGHEPGELHHRREAALATMLHAPRRNGVDRFRNGIAPQGGTGTATPQPNREKHRSADITERQLALVYR